MSGFTKRRHAFVYLRDLQAHPKVQRKFDPLWARKIRDSFDPDKFGEPAVVEDSGRYLVFDGQHRTWAAREVLGPDQKVPCIIYSEMPVERQADLFLGRSNVKAIRAIDKFRTAVLAEHDVETEITKALATLGLRLDEPRLPGVVRSPAALIKVHSRIGVTGLRRALSIIKTAWGSDPDAYDGIIIRATGELLRRFATEIDDEDFSRKLSRNGGPGQILGRARDFAKAAGMNVERAAVERMVNIYNKGRRTKTLSLASPAIADSGLQSAA